MKRFVQIVAIVAVPFATAAAQRTIVGMAGTIMRYHGDTIWMEHDSSMTRSITRGDTIEETSSTLLTNGARQRTVRYLVKGDSAWMLRDSPDGLPPMRGRHVPVDEATSLNRMLEIEARGAEAQARMQAIPMFADLDRPPTERKSYAVAPDVHMTRIRDTVLYIRGCLDQHPDTTVFLLFGADSVKRLSSPQRMFGQAMVLSLTSQMRMVALQEFSARMQAALPADLPKAPGGCSK